MQPVFLEPTPIIRISDCEPGANFLSFKMGREELIIHVDLSKIYYELDIYCIFSTEFFEQLS